MPIKKKTNPKTSQTKKKLPFYFRNESGKSLPNLEKEVWKKVDEFVQLEIIERLNSAFRTSQLSPTDLNLSKNPDYRHYFREEKKEAREDNGYYLLLEEYQLKKHQSLKYQAQKVTYRYLLMISKAILGSLSYLPFYSPEYVTKYLTN